MKPTALLLSAALLSSSAAIATTQTTAFTYQGQLKLNGAPVAGNRDLVFKLFDSVTGGLQVGSTVTATGYPLVDGLVNINLDFGAGAFAGQQRWVEISINGTFLSPRQAIAPTPVALYALSGNQGPAGPTGPTGAAGAQGVAGPQGAAGATGSTGLQGPIGPTGLQGPAGSANISGTAGKLVKFTGSTSGGNSLISDDGTGVSVNGALTVKNTVSALDATQPFSIKDGNSGGITIAPPTGGGVANLLGNGNSMSAAFQIGGTALGGNVNILDNDYATIAGGQFNHADSYATVGGGHLNVSSGSEATIAGGRQNRAVATNAAIGGGINNLVYGVGAVVPGGYFNLAGSDGSFAAGTNARARIPGNAPGTLPQGVTAADYSGTLTGDQGSFVWADSTNTIPASTSSPDQFVIRAHGGLRFIGAGVNSTTSPAFVQKVIASGTGANVCSGASSRMFIDHPLANNNPNAIILLTPSFGKNTGGAAPPSNPYGLYYTDVADVCPAGHWIIYDLTPTPQPFNNGAMFNVMIFLP